MELMAAFLSSRGESLNENGASTEKCRREMGKLEFWGKKTTTKLCAPDPAVPEVKKSTLGLPILKISIFFMLKPV